MRFVGGDVSPLLLLCLMDMCRAISGVPGGDCCGVLLFHYQMSSLVLRIPLSVLCFLLLTDEVEKPGCQAALLQRLWAGQLAQLFHASSCFAFWKRHGHNCA